MNIKARLQRIERQQKEHADRWGPRCTCWLEMQEVGASVYDDKPLTSEREAEIYAVIDRCPCHGEGSRFHHGLLLVYGGACEEEAA